VIQNAGFGMAFQTMPLFEQWGSTLAVVAGVCWFGLLFCWYYFISYGNTLDGIHERRFGWSQNKGAWSFGQ
jgi:hypothetical protein